MREIIYFVVCFMFLCYFVVVVVVYVYIFVNLIGNEERKKNESNEMNETGVLVSLVWFGYVGIRNWDCNHQR